MPDLEFVLPHWLYWMGLLVFPLIAMAMVKRTRAIGPDRGRTNVGVGYLCWLTGGFVGMHRYYVRSFLGFLYILPFIGILYANAEGRDARVELSQARTEISALEFKVEHYAKRVEDGYDDQAKLAEARTALEAAQTTIAEADANTVFWNDLALYLAIAIAVALAVDAVLLPRMVARQRERDPPSEPAQADPSERRTDTDLSRQPVFYRKIAQLSIWSGEFVAYWSVIAVFVYYYEVVARYVFNSPTNWAHEAMFLMFGMQYLIAGAYAYLTDSHVRVDVFYARLSGRGKALSDVLTSLFFFIFAGTLLATGWTFMLDAANMVAYRDFADLPGDTGRFATVLHGLTHPGQLWTHLNRTGEVSFTEWAIQYWPVKMALTLGALLILIQGLIKLARDIGVLFGHVPETAVEEG